MRKIILLFFLFLSDLSYSQRIFSNDIKIGILKNYDNNNIYVTEKSRSIFYKIGLNKTLNYKISPVCIIRNELNSFIVTRELKKNIRKPIAYKLENNKIKYIWILNNKEYQILIRKK